MGTAAIEGAFRDVYSSSDLASILSTSPSEDTSVMVIGRQHTAQSSI